MPKLLIVNYLAGHPYPYRHSEPKLPVDTYGVNIPCPALQQSRLN